VLSIWKFHLAALYKISEALHIQEKYLEEFDDYGEKRSRCWFIGKARDNYSSQLVPDSCIELIQEL
jgi:hypothetical protein